MIKRNKCFSIIFSVVLTLSLSVISVFAASFDFEGEPDDSVSLATPEINSMLDQYYEEHPTDNDSPDSLQQIYDAAMERDAEEYTTDEDGDTNIDIDSELATRPASGISYVLLAMSSKFAGEQFRLFEKGEDKGIFTLDAGGKMFFPLGQASSEVLIVRDGVSGDYIDIDPQHDDGGMIVIEIFLGREFQNVEFYVDTLQGRSVLKANDDGVVAISTPYDSHYDFYIREYFDFQSGEIDTTSALLAKEPAETESIEQTTAAIEEEPQKDIEKGMKAIGIAVAVIAVVFSAGYVLLFKKDSVGSLLKKKNGESDGE